MVKLLPPFHSLALPTAAHGEPSNLLGQWGCLNNNKKKSVHSYSTDYQRESRGSALVQKSNSRVQAGEGNDLLWRLWGLCSPTAPMDPGPTTTGARVRPLGGGVASRIGTWAISFVFVSQMPRVCPPTAPAKARTNQRGAPHAPTSPAAVKDCPYGDLTR